MGRNGRLGPDRRGALTDLPVRNRRLTRLHLTCIRDRLESLIDEAAEKQLTLREAVPFLVDREVARRNERRLGMAHFPAVRELADFDFKAQPSVDKRHIRELATVSLGGARRLGLVPRSPRVAKSHLAIALGREAVRHGYSVLLATAQAVMASLVKAHGKGGAGHCQVNRNPLFFDAKSIRANTTNQRLRWHVDQWNLHEIS